MTKFILFTTLVILSLNIVRALRCYDYDDKDCKVGEDCTKKEGTKMMECSEEQSKGGCGGSECDVCRTKVNRELI